jgi:hypothetical protein
MPTVNLNTIGYLKECVSRLAVLNRHNAILANLLGS